MRFSEWIYIRPDYEKVKESMVEYKTRIGSASSYDEMRKVWLDMKHSIEYFEYQEEIVYIRHLCGIDYENSLEEVKIQNSEEPYIYAIRDEINMLVKCSKFANEFEKEFGKQIFAYVSNRKISEESKKLQSAELQLKGQYRQMMASDKRDDNRLFEIFDRLIRIRRELADSLGYNSYIELGYYQRCRYDYGQNELFHFRNQIREYVTPICHEIKKSGIDLNYMPATVRDSKELISAISSMFHDLSYEAGSYIDEITGKELYDLDSRANKRPNLFTCCMLPYEKIPFIIGNYNGNGMETGYAVHEFGHGFAFYIAAQEQPLYEMHRSSPSVNEIHSKAMEHFMYPYLESFVGSRKKEYIRNHLSQQLENLVYRCAIDEFEHMMYDMPHKSKKEFCELWADISHKYMPWNTIKREEISEERCWPHQTHIVESPFYYIEYDVAQISTYEFYNKMKQDHKTAWADYMSLCQAGGSKSYLELINTANLTDPFSKDSVRNICEPIINELSRLL